MKGYSATRGIAPQEWTGSVVPPMIRANEARLAPHSAEHASRNWTPQALHFDGYFRQPVRMADLCRATGVGVRTVQRCFRQCFGATVTTYLKAVRLDAAYRDLIAAHPSRDTVTTIALRNGCNHLGRFSSVFRERFGQLPRETLRTLADVDVVGGGTGTEEATVARIRCEQPVLAIARAVNSSRSQRAA